MEHRINEPFRPALRGAQGRRDGAFAPPRGRVSINPSSHIPARRTAGDSREVRKQVLNPSLNAFAQIDPSVKAPKTASVKVDLSSPDGEVSTPYIEHWVLQLHGVAPERINDPEVMNETLNRVVSALNLTQVSTHSHYFGPGVSTVIILSESQLSAHSWPERWDSERMMTVATQGR